MQTVNDWQDTNHLEDVNCYNCEFDSHTYYAHENGFTLVKCLGCGLLYVTPRPSDEEIAQAHKYGVHKGDSRLEVTGQFDIVKVKNYLSVLGNLFGTKLTREKKTWLDIGCGHGEFITALQNFSQNNVLAKGIEPNVNKQKTARERGLDVSYFDLNTHNTQYDFISLLNVYSHLPNPKTTLINWKHLLKQGGELLLETGDTANLDSKDHLRPFNLPDHLSFASEKVVVNILKKAGFEITAIKKYPAFKWDTVKIIKETAKIFLPSKNSQIKQYIKSYDTDMYIKAKMAR